MYLIDSSGWVEFFANGPRAVNYARYMKDPSKIITPTIVLYEVYKKIRRERSEEEALTAASLISATSIVDLTESIALLAGDLSLSHSLPMADAIVYATALEEHCEVVTSDAHFRELDRVIFIS